MRDDSCATTTKSREMCAQNSVRYVVSQNYENIMGARLGSDPSRPSSPLPVRTNANAPTARLHRTLLISLCRHTIFLLTRALPGASARRVSAPVVPGVFVASFNLVVGGVFSFGENNPASTVVAAARAAAAAIALRPDGVLYADLTVSSAAAASRTLSSG